MSVGSITYNGFNTWRDWRLKMVERDTDPAEVKRATQDSIHTHGVLDFSRGKNEETYYYERPLHYRFKRVIPDIRERESLRNSIMQAINQYTDGKLWDSLEPYLYYKNAVCVQIYFGEISSNMFDVTIDFMAHPLREPDYFEGNKLWDTLNFRMDYIQNLSVELPDIADQLPFKQLQVDDLVTLGGWSQYRYSGKSGRLNAHEQERLYTISGVEDVGDTDFDNYRYSGVVYRLAEDNSRVRAQDIVQARQSPVEMTIYNSGASTVFPEIAMRTIARSFGGITIEQEGNFYNFRTGDYNDKFPLYRGRNDIKIYGQGMALDFLFKKEVH